MPRNVGVQQPGPGAGAPSEIGVRAMPALDGVVGYGSGIPGEAGSFRSLSGSAPGAPRPAEGQESRGFPGTGGCSRPDEPGQMARR